MDTRCTGEHRFFVAEVVGVEAEGTVTVITVCTQCGAVEFTKESVSTAGVSLRMLKDEKLLKGEK